MAEHVERLLIAGQLQDGRDGRAADVAAARIEQNEVAAAGDLVQKAGRVAAEEEGGLGLVVRNDVQQPEAGVPRPLRDLQNALDPAAAHFHDGAHALFLDRRQATDEVARRNGVAAEPAAELHGLVIGQADVAGDVLVHGARDQVAAQTDGLGDLLHHGRAARSGQIFKEFADDGVPGDAGREVRATALCADDQLMRVHRRTGACLDFFQHLADEPAAERDARLRAADLLQVKRLGRAAVGPREVADAVRLDIFAAVADDEHGADVRMNAVGQHALHDGLIVQTCERAGDIDVPVLRLKMRRDGLCDVLAALHGVEHEDLVADALAAVRAEPGLADRFCFHGVFLLSTAHRRRPPAGRSRRPALRRARQSRCACCADAHAHRERCPAWPCRCARRI